MITFKLLFDSWNVDQGPASGFSGLETAGKTHDAVWRSLRTNEELIINDEPRMRGTFACFDDPVIKPGQPQVWNSTWEEMGCARLVMKLRGTTWKELMWKWNWRLWVIATVYFLMLEVQLSLSGSLGCFWSSQHGGLAGLVTVDRRPDYQTYLPERTEAFHLLGKDRRKTNADSRTLCYEGREGGLTRLRKFFIPPLFQSMPERERGGQDARGSAQNCAWLHNSYPIHKWAIQIPQPSSFEHRHATNSTASQPYHNICSQPWRKADSYKCNKGKKVKWLATCLYPPSFVFLAWRGCGDLLSSTTCLESSSNSYLFLII